MAPDSSRPRPRRRGWAAVREGSFLQPWKQRFLVLRKEWIDFSKADGEKPVYTLFLKDIVGVGRVETTTPAFEFEVRRRIDGPSNSPGDKDGSIKTLQLRTKTEYDLYTWMDFIYNSCPYIGGVSNPTNFSHAVHVGFNANTREFVGLPLEWTRLLKASAITKEDYARNPQAVIQAVDFYADLTKRSDNPHEYLGLSPKHIVESPSRDASPARPTEKDNAPASPPPPKEPRPGQSPLREPDTIQAHRPAPPAATPKDKGRRSSRRGPKARDKDSSRRVPKEKDWRSSRHVPKESHTDSSRRRRVPKGTDEDKDKRTTRCVP
ncbi:hypothetical protein ACCO45_009643 [Purpureocillium lilacinum]|uniref:Uncharacterized protein n=1 Tax=Purpureocillium lilacinum TaxID=33203 RepID=A0ACC4DK93_PURLI